jgi:hypothetical protein
MSVDDLDDLPRAAAQLPADQLPRLVGRLVEAEVIARLRLMQQPSASPPPPARLIDAAEAAAIAGSSVRWILSATRGHRCRCDLSRKRPRFDDAAFRDWLAQRGRR